MCRIYIYGLMFFFLAGCAGFWTTAGVVVTNPIFQQTVQSAVMDYILDSSVKQSEAARIVAKLKNHVDESDVVTVSELEVITISEIPWEKLDTNEQWRLRGMLVVISQRLRQQVGEGELIGNEQVKVMEFLSWIENAIHFSRM